MTLRVSETSFLRSSLVSSSISMSFDFSLRAFKRLTKRKQVTDTSNVSTQYTLYRIHPLVSHQLLNELKKFSDIPMAGVPIVFSSDCLQYQRISVKGCFTTCTSFLLLFWGIFLPCSTASSTNDLFQPSLGESSGSTANVRSLRVTLEF